MDVRPVTSDLAALLGLNPSSCIADSTFFRVDSFTFGWPFTTRETDWCDTPANDATSNIEGVRLTIQKILHTPGLSSHHLLCS
jgi:hypothetical protein